jgi:hypothetical protein
MGMTMWILLPKGVRTVLGTLAVVLVCVFLYFLAITLPSRFPATWIGSLLLIVSITPWLALRALRELQRKHISRTDVGTQERITDYRKARVFFLAIEISASVLLVYWGDNAVIPFAKAHLSARDYSVHHEMYKGGGFHEEIQFHLPSKVLNVVLNNLLQLIYMLVAGGGIGLIALRYNRIVYRLEGEDFSRRLRLHQEGKGPRPF